MLFFSSKLHFENVTSRIYALLSSIGEGEGGETNQDFERSGYVHPSLGLSVANLLYPAGIEMALSYHQPHQHELVGGWKLIFGKKRAVVGRFFINPDDSKG